MPTRVGIVIAALNAEPYIGETLQSIRDQTFEDWQCVVVDDGSTDRTAEIVQAVAADDPVRAAAADAAVSAAARILSDTVRGETADTLLTQGIAEVRQKLN